MLYQIWLKYVIYVTIKVKNRKNWENRENMFIHNGISVYMSAGICVFIRENANEIQLNFNIDEC